MSSLPTNAGPRAAIAAAALAFAAITLAAGVASAGRDPAATAAEPSSAAPLRCEIRQSAEGGMILLEPMVTAAGGASGSYSLTLTGGGAGGSSSIRQGGDFTAAPGEPTRLGAVSLGASGTYRARLDVTAGPRRAACSGTVTGAL